MRETRYELDSEDRIRSVSGAWSVFAHENGASHLADGVVGSSIWDWVSGMEVQHLYRMLFSKLRRSRTSARFPFRCDSPDLRRFMELEISALPDHGIACIARLDRAERRPPVSLLDSQASRADTLLAICSWCKRVRVSRDLWLEIEEAVSRLRLLEDLPPSITHTICTDCDARLDDSE